MPDNARTLIVTGASSGIGRALALDAARAGCRVVMVARRGARLEELAQTIRDSGGACAVLAGDVTGREMPARIVDTAMRTFGRIDVVVNNAGRAAYGSLLEQSDAALDSQWQLGVAAPLRIARAALSALEATHGQLIFIGSGIARVPLPQWGGYPLAKAALRAAAVQLRRELRARGIAVTYVDPGVVRSEFHSSSGIERSPGFAASPQRIARAILRGIARRKAVVNAVPWQTAIAALGEWSGTLADPVVVGRFGGKPPLAAEPIAPPIPSRHPEPVIPDVSSRACHPERRRGTRDEGRAAAEEELTESLSFEEVLEPVARRMERVKLSPAFLRNALVPGATIDLNALAMRWAGMPNKNERAALREALDALATGGYLEHMEDETWRVLRAAD